MSDLVLVDVSEGIALITLNRPEASNALSSAMLARLVEHMGQLDARADVDVLILTGAGRAFCAGLDLKEMAASGANIRPGDGRPWPQLAKPLIGAVNGAAVTGGLELALACDFLVASDRARFADTHTRVGLVPFWGMSVLLPQAVGVRVAREMSLTGNFIGADEACRVGLVNRVVPHDELLTVVRALAADIALGRARGHPRAGGRVRRVLRRGSGGPGRRDSDRRGVPRSGYRSCAHRAPSDRPDRASSPASGLTRVLAVTFSKLAAASAVLSTTGAVLSTTGEDGNGDPIRHVRLRRCHH